MSRKQSLDPCRIDSDSDEEHNGKIVNSYRIESRPTTAKSIQKVITPKIAQWDVELQDETDFTDESRMERRNQEIFQPTNPRRNQSCSSSDSSASNDRNVPSSNLHSHETRVASSTPAVLSNYDPFVMIYEDRANFIYQSMSQDYPGFFQCRLQRDTSGVQGNFHPTFYLQAERPADGKKEFLLAARRVAKVKRTVDYIISLNIENLSKGSHAEGYVGRLKGNNLKSTQYTLYDNGLSPSKHSSSKLASENDNLRRELAGIIYNTNFLGFSGPRQINLLIPKVGRKIQPNSSEPTILSQWRDRRFADFLQLRNKAPTYNETTKTYVIQFAGNRVVKPSVKNFQIIMESDDHREEVIMQFGRIDSDVFTCDYRYPLSALQAFAIALSSFDSGIARE